MENKFISPTSMSSVGIFPLILLPSSVHFSLPALSHRQLRRTGCLFKLSTWTSL